VAAASAFFLAAYLFMTHAFRTAPAAYVAPFRYSALVWSLLLGFALWGQVPDVVVLIGALLIVAAGGYLVQHTWTQR
jgi:drug/metabolite transporter (DMT)-like permease